MLHYVDRCEQMQRTIKWTFSRHPVRWARKGEAELIKKTFVFIRPANVLLWSLPSPVSRLVPLFRVMLLYYYVVDRREWRESNWRRRKKNFGSLWCKIRSKINIIYLFIMNRKAMNAVHNSLRCFSALPRQNESCYGKLAGCCLILVIHSSLAHCCFVCNVVLSHSPAWHRRNFIELCKTIQLKNSMALTDRLNRLPLKCMEIFQLFFVDFPSTFGWWGEFWISLDSVVHACCFGWKRKTRFLVTSTNFLFTFVHSAQHRFIHSFNS